MTNDVNLGIIPDGGPMEGAPVLEPLEHSVPKPTLGEMCVKCNII